MSSKLSYLQKYLSSGESLKTADGKDTTETKRKKKKKKDKNKGGSHAGGFKIIDDDGFGSAAAASEREKSKKSGAATKYVDKGERPRLKEARKKGSDSEEDELSYATLEDRPQIAGFVDERPEVEIMKERRFTTSTFKTIVKSDDEDDDAAAGSTKSSSVPNLFPDFPIKEEPRDEDDDASPPRSKRRRKERHYSSDASPPRRRHDSSDGDASPPRRRRHDSSDSDNSPPRSGGGRGGRRRRVDNAGSDDDDDGDQSPPRKRERAANDSEEDNSPPRRSSSRPGGGGEKRVKAEPVLIKPDPDGDMSPPRKEKAMTLDGKKAGLQRAADLKDEMESLRKKERAKFQRLDASVSGRGAETVVRGRLKEKQREEEERRKKNEITDEVKAQYKKWSKGVKQGAMIEAKIAEDLRVMAEPLTRTRDDIELNAHLKEEEGHLKREEDPMVDYFRKKRAKKAGAKRIPTYQGPLPPPNRFQIAPGYRWDGVDRSTGFEKRFHERINRQKVTDSNAYSWSTEDM